MATMKEIMKRRYENKKAAAKRVYFISTPQSKSNPLYGLYVQAEERIAAAKGIMHLEQGGGKSCSLSKSPRGNKKKIPEMEIRDGQMWYLPEVINDTEGDAKVIPFPSKKDRRE